MKTFAAYCYCPNLGTKRDHIAVVFTHNKIDAEIELGRLRFDDRAKRVGITTRKERPRTIAAGLLHKFPGSSLTIRHIAPA